MVVNVEVRPTIMIAVFFFFFFSVQGPNRGKASAHPEKIYRTLGIRRGAQEGHGEMRGGKLPRESGEKLRTLESGGMSEIVPYVTKRPATTT